MELERAQNLSKHVSETAWSEDGERIRGKGWVKNSRGQLLMRAYGYYWMNEKEVRWFAATN